MTPSLIKLVGVDKGGSSLCLFDERSLAVVKRLPMPTAPHDIAIDRRSSRAFISIYGDGVYGDNPHPGNELVIVDLATFEQTGSINISPYTSPHGLAFDVDGALWAACDAHACVLRISIETGQVLDEVPTRSTGSHWVAANPRCRLLYTSNKEELFLSVIDPDKRRTIDTIPVPHGTEGICLSHDGKLLYAADRACGAVLVIATQTNRVIATIELEALKGLPPRTSHHVRVCASPDGDWLAVAAYHYNKLILVDCAETSRQFALDTDDGPMALAFSPLDPRRLYVSSHDGGSLFIVDTVTAGIVHSKRCDAAIESLHFY